MDSDWTIHFGDTLTVLPTLEAGSVHCCVTSPPYWGLRDYGVEGQLGLEPTPQAYIARMVEVFREVRRVLREDGTCWVNMGDCYVHGKPGGGSVFDNGRTDGRVSHESDKARGREKVSTLVDGLKTKDLVGMPWRLAFALQADGWYLRQDIIWHKPNPMPESVRDRCTKAHEYIFLLAKSERYYYDADVMQEPSVPYSVAHGKKYGNLPSINPKGNPDRNDNGGKAYLTQCGVGAGRETRNRRSVWTVTTKPYKGAHFATFPPKLIEPCILAGCPVGGTVLDPFTGSGTTGAVALEHGRKFVGIELNAAYIDLAKERIGKVTPRLVTGT